MSSKISQEKWSSRTGVILAVAASAVGLGNFLRFPGQAVQNGGGAFMVPYIISFFLLGLPVCISEWVMGRMGGHHHGHSYPMIMRTFLSGVPLRIVSTFGLMVPVLIYVYYVFVESWCLAYAYLFITNSFPVADLTSTTPDIVSKVSHYFVELTGSHRNGAILESPLLYFTLICYLLNFIMVSRGLNKGLEALAKIAIPMMIGCSAIILIRVLTLDGISLGLGKMWNPDWSSLFDPKVWVSASGQIFFSLSTGFGIALVFSSFLKRNDDVYLSSTTSASINEFIEIAIGGMITIPVAFLFLGPMVTEFGTFGLGFTALPTVFLKLQYGSLFGGIWFFALFLAALTSSVTMLQPALLFFEEGLHWSKTKSILFLAVFTLSLSTPILYFNLDFTSLDIMDFFVGTILIYLLATFQIMVYTFKIGKEKGKWEGSQGSLIKLPEIYYFVQKYITPVFLVLLFVLFLSGHLPEYIHKITSSQITEGMSSIEIDNANSKALIAKFTLIGLIPVTFLFYSLVEFGYRRNPIK